MSGLGNKEIMAKNLRHYMDVNNKTRNEICSALDVSYSTFTDWINGNSYPRIDKIELLANYFGIEKADLIEEQNDRQDSLSKEERNLILNYRMLIEDDRKLAHDIIINVKRMNPDNKKRLFKYYKMIANMQSMDDELIAAHNDTIDDEQIRLMNEDLEDE